MLHRKTRNMKVQKNRKSKLTKAGVLFCSALLLAAWIELDVQAQNAPVVKTPAQVAEEEAVRRQEAVVQIRTYLDQADKARADRNWTEAARLYGDAYKTLSQVGQAGATDEYRRIAVGITEVSVYEAQQALKRGDYELAIEKLDYALRIDPTSIKAQNARESALQQRALAKNRVTSREIREHQEDMTREKDQVNQIVHDAKMLYEMGSYQKAHEKIEAQRQEVLAMMREKGVTEPRNLEEQALTLVGKDIYEKLIKGYTEKQWGRKCTELPAFIIRRLPVRLVFDNNYFNDKYQGIPMGGYNRLVSGLLEGVETKTGVDFFDNREYWESVADKIVFTGKIDEFYDYRFGKLEYRTVRFETETLDMANYQGNAVINYTEREVPYTRVIEHKHFEMFGQEVYDVPKTVISREYSVEWTEGMDPYYPVNDERNGELYKKYKSLADCESKVLFGGRLAEYKYYDMAPVIESAINLFQNK